MPSFSALITTATTTTLVAAPSAGQTIEVFAFDIVAKATDGTVELRTGSTRLHGIHTPATGVGGLSKPMAEGNTGPYFTCADATALTAVTSAAGSVFINGTYRITDA